MGKRPPPANHSARKRRPPIIEATAVEIAVEPLAPAAGVEPQAAPSQPPPEPPPAEPVSQAAPPPPPPPPEPPRQPPHHEPGPDRPAIAWLPPDLPWPVVGAGAAGGAAALLLLLLLLWLLIPSRDPAAALNPRLASIETQLRELASRPLPQPTDPKAVEDYRKAVEDLGARTGRLEIAASAPRPPATDPALAGRVTSLENALKSLLDSQAALMRRTDDVAAAVREARGRADASAASAASLENAARASAADHGQIEALAGRVVALERTDRNVAEELTRRASAATSDRPVRLAVAAGALRAAVERGDPFAAELAIVKPLAGDGAALAVLEPFAAAGVPSAAALGRELGALLPAMLKTAGAAPRGDGIMDRLQANAERLVRVRPVDDAPGNDPVAVLARIEAKAAHSDIAGALAELAKLPPQVRAPAQTWIAKAEGRGRAMEASRKFAADAVSALKTAQ